MENFELKGTKGNCILALDEMFETLKMAKSNISRLQNSMMAHPDCTTGSEFEDYANLAQDHIEKIEQNFKKFLVSLSLH